jgi:hypothetical protein
MRRTSVSRPHRLVCPACGYGALHPRGPLSRSAYYCKSCWCSFGGATVGTLKQIAALPDAVGKHACEECAHPEDALSGRRDVLLLRLPIRGGAYYRIQPPRCREPYRRRRTKRVAGIGAIGGIGRAEQG